MQCVGSRCGHTYVYIHVINTLCCVCLCSYVYLLVHYGRLLSYKVSSDGQVEGEDSYLKRMSGIVRLYAAILQTPSEPHPHPHGLEHGWAWFARVLNMEPHPTLTATAIYDMLEVRHREGGVRQLVCV